jgi:pimeloyl-ACP methyl ester carboxylesterase
MPLAPDSTPNADLLRVPIGPGSVHVDRYGFGGRPVVLLHGFGTSSFLWRYVGPGLAVAGMRAFAMDLVGYGESDRPLDASFGIAAQAEYLDRALTALRVASAIVVGVDLGGAVALRLAAVHPERVAGLVLVNPLVPGSCPGDEVAALKWRTARFAFRLARGQLGAASVLHDILRRMVADPEHMPPRLVARYLAPYVGRDGVTHLLTLARAIDEGDLDELELQYLETPTMVVRGLSDELVDGKAVRRMTETIPGARFVELPGVGRLVPEEYPNRLVSLILEHAGLRQPGPPTAPELPDESVLLEIPDDEGLELMPDAMQDAGTERSSSASAIDRSEAPGMPRGV